MQIKVTIREGWEHDPYKRLSPPPPDPNKLPAGATEREIARPPKAPKRYKMFCPDCTGDGGLHAYFGDGVLPCSNCLGKGFIYIKGGFSDTICVMPNLSLADALTYLTQAGIFTIPNICAFVLNVALGLATVWFFRVLSPL